MPLRDKDTLFVPLIPFVASHSLLKGVTVLKLPEALLTVSIEFLRLLFLIIANFPRKSLFLASCGMSSFEPVNIQRRFALAHPGRKIKWQLTEMNNEALNLNLQSNSITFKLESKKCGAMVKIQRCARDKTSARSRCCTLHPLYRREVTSYFCAFSSALSTSHLSHYYC